MTLPEQLGFFLLFFFSVVFRELSRGYIATFFGDTTPYHAGRLTINPIKHVDIFGTIILPIVFVLFGVPAIGWAKPMPLSLRAIKQTSKRIITVLSGIFANILLIVFSLVCVFVVHKFFPTHIFAVQAFALLAYMNIILVVFHIIPIPPLDGFMILSELPYMWCRRFTKWVTDIHPLILFFVILGIWNVLYPLVDFLYAFLVR